jgi:hypothetical protein
MFGDIGKLMKQAQALQEKMGALREEMEGLRVDGVAGGGLVTVTLDGTGAMRGAKIDPSLMKPGEEEILEDLIVAAHANARTKVETEAQARMKDATGGLELPPGMKLPF